MVLAPRVPSQARVVALGKSHPESPIYECENDIECHFHWAHFACFLSLFHSTDSTKSSKSTGSSKKSSSKDSSSSKGSGRCEECRCLGEDDCKIWTCTVTLSPIFRYAHTKFVSRIVISKRLLLVRKWKSSLALGENSNVCLCLMPLLLHCNMELVYRFQLRGHHI